MRFARHEQVTICLIEQQLKNRRFVDDLECNYWQKKKSGISDFYSDILIKVTRTGYSNNSSAFAFSAINIAYTVDIEVLSFPVSIRAIWLKASPDL